MRSTMAIAMIAGAFSLFTATTQANANPTAGIQLRPLEIIGQNGDVHQVHQRSFRHCHRRVRRCRNVRLNSDRTVRRCTTVSAAFCHGPRRSRGSHSG